MWLDVLQGILQLQGNQWQPESPRDHKLVWMFPPSAQLHIPVKHRLHTFKHVRSITAEWFTGESLLAVVGLVSFKICSFLFCYSDFIFFVCFFGYVFSELWLCQLNLDHWGYFAFSGLVICLLSKASFFYFVSQFDLLLSFDCSDDIYSEVILHGIGNLVIFISFICQYCHQCAQVYNNHPCVNIYLTPYWVAFH